MDWFSLSNDSSVLIHPVLESTAKRFPPEETSSEIPLPPIEEEEEEEVGRLPPPPGESTEKA